VFAPPPAGDAPLVPAAPPFDDDVPAAPPFALPLLDVPAPLVAELPPVVALVPPPEADIPAAPPLVVVAPPEPGAFAPVPLSPCDEGGAFVPQPSVEAKNAAK
jgi:hypothetical protein